MCGDPEKVWYPQRHICYADMEQAAANRAYKELHEARPWHNGTFKSWAAERSAKFPYSYDDGVMVTVAAEDFQPDDDFLTPASPQLANDGGDRD